jgi:hypothetical protein
VIRSGEWIRAEIWRRWISCGARLSENQLAAAHSLLSREWGNENDLRILEEARKRSAVGSVVYFVQESVSNAIKIGTSVNLDRRIRALKSYFPMGSLTVLATVPGGHGVESWMHSKFKDARIRGEWFRPASELLTYVEWILNPGMNKKKFRVTDPYLDAPDGATLDGYERVGDWWIPMSTEKADKIVASIHGPSEKERIEATPGRQNQRGRKPRRSVTP